MLRFDDLEQTGFAGHLASPTISVGEHLLSKTRTLGAWALKRKRMYLDTCWWIRLRDVRIGRSKDARHEELLLRLQSLVRSGHLICPIGEGAYLELLKQADVMTRNAAILLMDDLGAGVAIIDSRHRARVEAMYFLTETITNRVIAGPPLDRVWTKVSMVLGVPTPVFPDVPEEKQLAIQKTIVDMLWSMSLADFLHDEPSVDRDERILRLGAEQIASASAAHAHEMKSFEQVFLAEVGGFVDLYSDVLGGAFEKIYKLTHQGAPPITAAERQSAQNLARRMFYNLFRYKKIGNALPIINIYAGLHAMNRWLKKRPFRVQDFYDFAHASAAIPYCDYFLTERHLATVITNTRLQFDTRYGVSVMHTVNQALDALNCLAS